MTDHTIGTREEWLAAREQSLVREKEHTRLADELAQRRRDLPWVRVEKESPMLEAGMPPIVAHNAGSTGTDVVGYLTELFGFSTFVRDDGTVYHTYSTTGRGVEFLMGYYPILDRAPNGRDEGKAWQVWIRRHDEYDGATERRQR
jgi:predicted dithiol-disulfide oxidoreductase (DUF899 family)